MARSLPRQANPNSSTLARHRTTSNGDGTEPLASDFTRGVWNSHWGSARTWRRTRSSFPRARGLGVR
jgi:hypothetical protein